jgi:penicillin-binding protein 1A
MPYESKHDKLQIPHRYRKWIIRFLLFFGILVVGSVTGVAGAIWYFSRDLPSIETLHDYQPSIVTKVYGEDNELIGQFFVERRFLVPLEEIPEALRQAIVAVEDARFYEHKGLDPLGIVRAFIANLESFSLRQGGSTITQQLTRSLFLSPEKSFRRKIKEAILAWKMEKILSKDEILELYLNQIYLGHGAYGVQSAARTYFDKDVNELHLAEVTFIAGLPRAPSDYSPYNRPELAKRRQGVVLRRMVQEGYLSEEGFREVYQQDLYFKSLKEKEMIAAYFLEYIRQYLTATYGDAMVYKGGLTVHTTLNLTLQNAATEALRAGLRDLDKRQGYRGPIDRKPPEEIAELEETAGAVIVGDVSEGSILEGVVTQVNHDGATVIASGLKGRITASRMAWAKKQLVGPDLIKDGKFNPEAKPSDIVSVGDMILVRVHKVDLDERSADFSLEQEPAVEGGLISLDPRTGAIKAMVGGYDFKRSEFNRAVSAKRQPGSAFKPIIYATALDQGLTPATILVDAPIVYVDEEQQRIWKPENYESKFYGLISLREGLTHSRNLATVRLLEQVGIRNVIQFARQLGIKSPLTPDLSLALGSSSLTLLELTSAFGVFANEGVRADPKAVVSVMDSSGQILEEHLPFAEPVIRKETAYLITNILIDVIQRGTGRKARVLGKALAGKTGTTNDFTDAWFVGFSPNLAAGVWVGFDDMRSLGNKEAGARAALPIWISYMRTALDVPAQLQATFSIPENVVFSRIDPKTGLLAADGVAESQIEIFVKGTEPSVYARLKPKPADFFRLDSTEK